MTCANDITIFTRLKKPVKFLRYGLHVSKGILYLRINRRPATKAPFIFKYGKQQTNSMLKIETRTWNNILIFTVIILILIFNIDRFRSSEPSQRLVVPEGEYIVNLSINQLKIEKAGPIWQVSPNSIQPETMPSNEVLYKLVSAWQQAYLRPAELAFSLELFASPEVIIEIMLAGKSSPLIVSLHLVQEQLFFVIEKQVYVLESPKIQTLLEPIVYVRQ